MSNGPKVLLARSQRDIGWQNRQAARLTDVWQDIPEWNALLPYVSHPRLSRAASAPLQQG